MSHGLGLPASADGNVHRVPYGDNKEMGMSELREKNRIKHSGGVDIEVHGPLAPKKRALLRWD